MPRRTNQHQLNEHKLPRRAAGGEEGESVVESVGAVWLGGANCAADNGSIGLHIGRHGDDGHGQNAHSRDQRRDQMK